jgi:hypothetical protein
VCTVSWVHQPGGYHLLCNRDEKLTRGTAFAPVVIEHGGVRYVAPLDADFGGTWIAANELGISVCLLNGEAASLASGALPRRSRGLLLQELAGASTVGECVLWLRQLNLGAFAPFALLALEPDRSAIVAEWNGEYLSIDPAGGSHMPLTSSSYDAPGVSTLPPKRIRAPGWPGRMRRSGSSPRISFEPRFSSGWYSPCMHRDDAETVSFSWVIVTRDEIRFLYSPSAPCRRSPSEQQIMARAA